MLTNRNHDIPFCYACSSSRCVVRIFSEGETFMKGLTRKRLIPSLAASVMVAAATLAPLPGFLAAGSVHAGSAFSARNFIEIHREAEFIASTPPFGVALVNVVSTYKCSPVGGNTTATLRVTLTQGSTGGTG